MKEAMKQCSFKHVNLLTLLYYISISVMQLPCLIFNVEISTLKNKNCSIFDQIPFYVVCLSNSFLY
jgi:hypothetical protein